MITILASVAGFVSSIIPECIKYMHDKSDKKHEIEILKMQMQMKNSDSKNKLEEIVHMSEALDSSYFSATYNTGIDWVDALNGTVRPVLAYAFFFLYGFSKYLQFQLCNMSMKVMMVNPEIIWSGEDQAIFAGIISFYYGQRALAKFRK